MVLNHYHLIRSKEELQMLKQDLTNTIQYYDNKIKLLTAKTREKFQTQYETGCVAILRHKIDHLTLLLVKAKATFDDILVDNSIRKPKPGTILTSSESDSDSDTDSEIDDDERNDEILSVL